MKDFKGAIFDLDGTVLDSMWVWDDIDAKFLGKRGIEVPPDYIEKITPMGFRAAALYTIERFGLTEAAEDIIVEWGALAIDAYTHEIGLKAGVREYLTHLKSKGVRLSVATASSPLLYEPALKSNKIFELFDAFTTTEEVARGKGFPDIYLLAAQKIGVKASECAVFEDIYAGIKGANDGGFYTVGVYEPCSEREREQIISCADLYIRDYDELLNGDIAD